MRGQLVSSDTIRPLGRRVRDGRRVRRGRAGQRGGALRAHARADGQPLERAHHVPGAARALRVRPRASARVDPLPGARALTCARTRNIPRRECSELLLRALIPNP